MAERTFTYRTGNTVFTVVFLTVWGLGAGVGGVASTATGNMRFNGHLVSTDEAPPYVIGFGVAGLAVLGLTARLFLAWLNERVIVSDTEVVWIDWRGRERLRTVRAGIHLQKRLVSDSSNSATVFSTQSGELRIGRGVQDFAVLRDLLTTGTPIAQATDLPEASPAHKPKYVPAEKTYRYRGSLLHLFSFVWLGIIGFMVVMFFTTGQVEKSTSVLFPIFFITLLGAFAALGVWMQLMGWRESITFGPDGIRWIDCLGRVKVQTDLAGIRTMDRIPGNLSMAKIYTNEGVIQASGYLSGFQNLVTEVQKTLDSR